MSNNIVVDKETVLWSKVLQWKQINSCIIRYCLCVKVHSHKHNTEIKRWNTIKVYFKKLNVNTFSQISVYWKQIIIGGFKIKTIAWTSTFSTFPELLTSVSHTALTPSKVQKTQSWYKLEEHEHISQARETTQ